MSVPRIRLETVEAIARKILMEYDSSLLSGEPRPIPIEAIIEVKFDLICLFGYVIPELMDGVPRLYPD